MKTPRFWQYDGFLAHLLAPISRVYELVTEWRLNHGKPYRTKAKVICVGNITAGGVGKTPVAVAIAKQYLDRGMKVVFLTRGYKSKLKNTVVDLSKHSAEETGDEARILAKTAPVIIAPDRKKGAMMAENMGAEVIVMDDGLQNPGLYKDKSYLVFDGALGIGNGRIIPAGPLRQKLNNGEKRAQAVIIMGDDKTGLAKCTKLPVYFGRLVPKPLELQNKLVLAFAGIGHPEKFYETLRSLHYEVVESVDFADHYAYLDSDIEKLYKRARELNAALVTTEKDFVKLSSEMQKKVHCLYVEAVLEG